jgi:Phosphotransferase enzyme family
VERVTAQERRRLAIEAALAVAGELGIGAEGATILKDSNKLVPVPIVAKVGTSHFRDARLELLERELAVATHLADSGAPVVRPTRDVAPGPRHWRNVTLTLWQYAEPLQGVALGSTEVASAVSTVHEALLDFPGSLPPFTLELEDARRLLQAERSPALGGADRRFLWAVLDEVQAALSTSARADKPLHGSPHAGNWLATAEGLLLLDFETACRGPIEWDLGALDDEAVDLFADVDDELIALLRGCAVCASPPSAGSSPTGRPRCPRRHTST